MMICKLKVHADNLIQDLLKTKHISPSFGAPRRGRQIFCLEPSVTGIKRAQQEAPKHQRMSGHGYWECRWPRRRTDPW